MAVVIVVAGPQGFVIGLNAGESICPFTPEDDVLWELKCSSYDFVGSLVGLVVGVAESGTPCR